MFDQCFRNKIFLLIRDLLPRMFLDNNIVAKRDIINEERIVLTYEQNILLNTQQLF